MMDIQKIGAYISRLRKEQDMTQLELAEYCNVSHQAVSKWERGESLPDISIFPMLAERFNVTIDDLLHAGQEPKRTKTHQVGTIVKEMADNKPEHITQMMNEGQVDPEALLEAAPMLKSSSLHEVVKGMDAKRLNFEHLIGLAPFLSDKDLDLLVTDMLEGTEGGLPWKQLSSLAPFLSGRSLDLIVNRLSKESISPNQLHGIAPFLEAEHLNQLVRCAVTDKLDWNVVVSLAPHLEDDTLEWLVEQAMNQTLEPKLLVGLAPFLSEEHLDHIARHSVKDKLDWNVVVSLAPFLEEETLGWLVEQTVEGEIEANQIVSLAPFLEDEHLELLLAKAQDGTINSDLVVKLAPFAGEGMLSKVILNFIKKS